MAHSSAPNLRPASSASSPCGSTTSGACERAVRAWGSFISAFVDLAVGGHLLPRTTPSPSHTFPPPQHPELPIKQSHEGKVLPEALGFLQVRNDPKHFQVEAPERIVAVGDVHGDLNKTREALSVARLIDDKDKWIGGTSVLVQVGDVLDRGGEEIQIFYLLEKLKHEAKKAGGAVHTLLGNHETGNLEGWFRYASKSGIKDFQRWAAWQRWGNAMIDSCKGPEESPSPDPTSGVPVTVPEALRPRFAALMPFGPITQRFIAGNPVTLRLGDTLFVHGGVLPEHVNYGLDNINEEAKVWLNSGPTPDGGPHRAPAFFHTSKAIVWVRDYSHNNAEECDCKKLDQVLEMLPGVSRMVMGHTIQDGGVNAACGGRAVRVDVGMSKGCGDYAPEVLEIIRGGTLSVLTKRQPPRPIPLHNPEEGEPKVGSPLLL